MYQDSLYSFVFRGLLTDVSLDKTGFHNQGKFSDKLEADMVKRLGIPLLEEEMVLRARKMSLVYIAICAFENSIRSFIEKKFHDEGLDNWWESNVNAGIRDKAAGRKTAEVGIRWLTPRGSSMLYYTEFPDLISIMTSESNWKYFEVHLYDRDWAQGIITTLSKSRNIIMHGGELSQVDIERVGMFIRDWVNQVG